jgi:hypothetical protein
MSTLFPQGPAFRLTSLVGMGLRTFLARRIPLLSNLRHWKENSAGIQIAQLRSVLRTAQHTEFGKAKSFSKLLALDNHDIVEAFRSEIPVADWYAYASLIERMRVGGERDILWPGLVMDYAQTSGTTAGDKFIPVSQQMLRSNFLASLDIFGSLARFGVPLGQMLAGKSLFLGGSTDLTTNTHGVRTGDLSGIVTPLIRWPLSEIYLPGPKIALMSHWPSKIQAMAERCLHEDVRMVSGMCSWGLVLFEKVLELARAQGRKASVITDVWPNFSVFVHGGVKYTPFDSRMRAIYSGSADGADIPVRCELYPASEGFVAIQDTPRDPGLRMLTDIGNFIEFVPLAEASNPAPRAHACWEVEKGQRYVVTLTTCAGLYRYLLGDVVEFDTIPDRPHFLGGGGGEGPARLRIVGRHKHFINAFGENLIVEHIENAVAKASHAAQLIVGEFTAAPVYPQGESKAGLELVVELAQPAHTPQASAQLGLFRDAFDASLKAQNADYTTKRTDSLGMQPPTITPVPVGTFHAWLASKGKLGGQHKCPRCANHRDIIDALLAQAAAHAPRP